MFQLQNTLVSEDLIDYDFVCNLNACKGACCIDGDAGAPVEDEETAILERIFPQVRPFLTPEGIEAIEAQGTLVIGSDGEKETPLVGGSCLCLCGRWSPWHHPLWNRGGLQCGSSGLAQARFLSFIPGAHPRL